MLSKSFPSISLALNEILYVPCITRNLLFFSKFYRDDKVMFEFITDKGYIEPEVSRRTLLEGFLD